MKKKIILVILFLIVSLIGTGLVYGFNTISQINEMVAEPKLDETNLAVNNDLDIDTVNIAVFGVDGRSDIDGSRLPLGRPKWAVRISLPPPWMSSFSVGSVSTMRVASVMTIWPSFSSSGTL